MLERVGLNLVGAVGIVCITLVYRKTNSVLYENESIENINLERKKLNASFIRAFGAILWPLVLFSIVYKDDVSNEVLVVPLLINAAIWYLDSSLMNQTKSNDKDTIPSLRIDASALTGLGLAMSTLVGNRPTSKHTHMFIYSLVACFLVVLPSHNLEQSCLEAQIFESVQKSVLLWCVCSIIAAVVLTRYHSTVCVYSDGVASE
jgi:hypothetical protein